MGEKPKFIVKLSRLWLLLGTLFLLLAMQVSFWLIPILTKGESSPSSGDESVCMTVTFIVIIFLICVAALSLKKWHLIKKGEKSAVKSSFFLSSLFLLVFGCVTGYIAWVDLGNPNPVTVYQIFPYFLLVLILIVNVTIIVLSSRPQVKEFLKNHQ